MDNHSLVEVAYMFHRVYSTIINGERWLIEAPRKSCPFDFMRERWPRNLVQRPVHSVVTQASARRAFIPSFVMVLLIIGERLTGWGSWPLSIANILFIIRGNIRIGRSSLSSCLALAFCSWETWLPPREWLLLACMVCKLTSRSLLRSRLMKSSWRWDPMDSS